MNQSKVINISALITQFFPEEPERAAKAATLTGAVSDMEFDCLLRTLDQHPLEEGYGSVIGFQHKETGRALVGRIQRFEGTPIPMYGLSLTEAGDAHGLESFALFADEGNGVTPIEFAMKPVADLPEPVRNAVADAVNAAI
jgi:hypothetical protein